MAKDIEALLNIYHMYTSNTYPGYNTSLPIYTAIIISPVKRKQWKRNKILSNSLLLSSSPSCKCISDVPHSLQGLKIKPPTTLIKPAPSDKQWSHCDLVFITVSLISIS